MMSLSVSGDGPWVAWWKSSNGNKLRRHYTATKEEAETQAQKWQMSLRPGEQVGITIIGEPALWQPARQ
jgi:hypothetical protein